MIRLSREDSSTVSSLVQYHKGLPAERVDKLLSELSPVGREIADAFLDPQRYAESSAEVRAAVDQYQAWLESNRRIRESRPHRERVGGLR